MDIDKFNKFLAKLSEPNDNPNEKREINKAEFEKFLNSGQPSQPALKERIVATHFIEVYSDNKMSPERNSICTNGGCFSDYEEQIRFTNSTNVLQTIAIFKIKMK